MKFIFCYCVCRNFVPIKRLFRKSVLLFSFAMALMVFVSGCGSVTTEVFDINSINYYTNIPGITEEEINDIEALKDSKNLFSYGALTGEELFKQQDGAYDGFTRKFCELLTSLFGIPFEIEVFESWDMLKSEHDKTAIDFIGTLCPTPERMTIYQMSNPIMERGLKIFTHIDRTEIATELDVDNLKIGFFAGTITAEYIKKAYNITFDIVEIDSYEEAARMILSGEIDAFVEESDIELLLDYKEIIAKKMFSKVYLPISMSSANSEFASIISVLNKYLTAGGVDNLLNLYKEGEREYAKYKLTRVLTDEEKAYLESTATNPVKLALEHDNYPISFYNSSESIYQGIAIDIIDEITKLIGINFEVVTNESMTWTEILEILKTGEASMVTELHHTRERESDFIWSNTPYSISAYALLSRIDYPDILNHQVSRSVIGNLANTGHEYIFYEWFPEHTKIKQYDSQSEGVSAIVNGEIDLLMASEFMQLSQNNFYENSGLKINTILSTPMESYFGFNKHEEILCSIISKAQVEIDTYAIERAWTSRNFDYQKKAATDRANSFIIFISVLIVVLILIMYLFIKNKLLNDNLSNIVEKRTTELEHQTATITAIYESIPDIVFSLDENLVYTSCNPSFEKFMGNTQKDIVGKKVEDIRSYYCVADFFIKSNEEVLESCKTIVFEESIIYPSGKLETLEIIKVPMLQNGKIIGILGIARNITERKTADERVKLMLDATPLACNFLDEEFNIIDTNEEAAKLFGLKGKKEYLERFWEIFPEYQPDGQLSRKKAHEMISLAFRTGKVVFEWMHRKPDDDTPIPSELTLVRTRHGNENVITGYIRDLREHNKMLEEIEYRSQLLQTMNNIASVLLQSEITKFDEDLWRCMKMMAEAINVDRVYIWKNSVKNEKLYCTQIYEWSENAVPMQGKEISFDTSYSDTVPSWEGTLSSGQCVNGIVRNLSSAEQEALMPQGILSILIVPILLQDTFWGFVGFDDCHRERVFNDDEVTVLRSGGILIASALLRNEMTLDIQHAVITAQEASRAKSNFLSNMSHEIRTPLNAITGMTIIGKSASDAKKKDYTLGKIEEASSHLLGVINDILDMSKIEANKFELSSGGFNFEKMIQKVVNVINFRVFEKKQSLLINIDNKMPRYLVGDCQRLSQVITNLLSNAVKFTPKYGHIWLHAYMLKEENGICNIKIDVKDTGIGVDPARQPYIFDSFEQSDNNTARKYGGTGLGLSISKYIVELMGGEIYLTSELGEGSTFSFTVKIKRGKDESLPILNTERGDIRILAVDDKSEIRECFENIADQIKVNCDTIGSGKEALQLIDKGNKYDIVFVDWNMSGMNGVELAKEIKKRNLDATSIVIVSAFDWSEIENEATEAGIDKFMPKPIFSFSIIDCINECLGHQNFSGQGGKNEQSISFNGYTLLLAEDVEINRDIIMSLLEETGIEIDCAENGIQAVQKFSDAPERYNLIFMDIQMPEMDGLEATRKIRSLGYAKAEEIPIIAMTANVFREDIEKCKEAGMNDHVGKPLDIDVVLDKMTKYLRLSN